MLKAVSISNIAVIKDLNVEFDDGFTVITGETGAGKSVLLDSILLVLGARTDKDMIRTGEQRAEVTALFDSLADKAAALEELGFPPDDNGELCLYRYITDDGKSGAKINGKSVPLSALRLVALHLIAVHGQQDSGALSDKSSLIALLDAYIGDESELEEYRAVYKDLCEAQSRLSSMIESVKDKSMLLDILEYQLREIESAKLSDPDEEDKLLTLRTKLRSLEKVSKNVSIVNRALIDNEKGVTATYMIEKASAAVRQLSEVLPGAEDISSKLDDIKYQLSEISDTVSDLISDDDFNDPEKKLDAVEKRLSLLKRLRGKYGENVSEIISKRDEIRHRINDLKNSDDAIEDLENSIKSLGGIAEKKAEVLSALRREHADVLTKQISSVLKDLDMPKVRFRIKTDKRTADGKTEFDANGFDDVDFLVSANVGEEMQPISKIASGGELSRIMLAVKSSMHNKSGEGTSIFDEIDAGVSGGTSERIGRKLRDMSRGSQLICITHSAQIASLADTHLKISKSEKDGRVESAVERLDRDGRIKELSRIIGGVKITQKVIDTAEEMLKKNND